MGIAFLIRYGSLLAMLPIVLHAAHKRNRWFLITAAVFVFAILPWSLWSYDNHGTPFKEHTTYYLTGVGLDLKETSEPLEIFIKWFFPLIIPLAIIGVIYALKDNGLRSLRNPYFLFLVFTFASFLLWPIKDGRYLLPAVFPLVYFSMGPLTRVPRNVVIPFLVLALVSQLWMGMSHVDIAKNKYVLLEDGGHWIRDNTAKDSQVMTQSFRQIAFYSQRQTYEVPGDQKNVLRFINEHNITYVLIDSYERTTPKYLQSFIDDAEYRELAAFNDDHGKVAIYGIE
jgi:hypothetical protein